MSEPSIKPDRAPVAAATPTLSFNPVRFDVPGRIAPLELRVTAPATGEALPILLLSHGHGASNYLSSSRGYAPLVDFYAAHGFVVIQPTHQDSKTLALDPTGPEGPLFWRSRARDMHFILDHLDAIEAAVPFLAGRLAKDRVVAVGHSLGGHTVCLLAGMRMTDGDGNLVDLTDSRLKAAVVFGGPGDGKDVAAWAAENYPDLKHNDFSAMTLPMLVVAGDKDFHPFFSERQDWRADAYRLGPAPKTLLTVFGAEHLYGGISGYDAKEATDEDPQRLADMQRLSWAYLRSALDPQDSAWPVVVEELATADKPVAAVQSK